MKIMLTTAAAALISTAAIADESDRYNDLRLNTADKAERVFSDDTNNTDIDGAQRGADQRQTTANENKTPDVSFSTRNNDIRSPGEGYVYGGFGPGNDSR